jgi:uncharacterized protein
MEMSKKSTAILVFSYRPEKEASIKRLLPNQSFKKNLAVYQQLHDRLDKIILESDIPSLKIDDTLQRGNQFEERLFNSLSDGFDKGFENLIVLGNDAPAISTDDIQWANDQLQKGHSAVILSQLGGASLIALSRTDFEKLKGLKIKWRSKSTGRELAGALQNCAVRSGLIELNAWSDLVFFKSNNAYHALSLLLSKILTIKVLRTSELQILPIRIHQENHPFRGPPSQF